MYFFAFIHIVNRVVSGDIYTAGKNFTLPLAVTAWTNITSAIQTPASQKIHRASTALVDKSP